MERLVSGLCARLGLPAPRPDALGGYALIFPDSFTAVITPVRDGMVFAGDIAALPTGEGEKDALCRELLMLSLGRTGQECASSLPRLVVEGTALVLRQQTEAASSVDELEERLESFFNLMEKWRGLASKEQGRQTFRSGGGMQSIILP